MADYIGATPQSNPLMGLLAERLKQAQQFAVKPFGYQNPPAEMLMNLLGVPAVQQTAERLAYGEPLTTGRGMTTQVRPEALEAAMTVAPVAGLLGRGTERAAMAAGRAGERYAEKVVPQIMEQGGLTAQLLGDLSQGSIRPMDVWHGSTNKELTQLNPKKSFGNLGVSWVSPEEEFAKRYAGKEGKVYKLDLNEGKNFDFANQEHLNLLKEKTKSVDIYDPIRGAMTLDKKVPDSGSYYSAEDPQLFNAIKKMGFDTVSVYEDGVRNIGVFNPKKNIKFIDESSDAGLLGQSKAASAFPVGQSGLLQSPRSLTMPDVPTAQQMEKYGRVETVPLSQAVSFQSARDWETFGKKPNGDLIKGYGDKPVALRLETGEYVIYDGNHRTDLAMQAGKSELPMHVIDVRSYDPAHAGRKPAPEKMTDDELLRSLLD